MADRVSEVLLRYRVIKDDIATVKAELARVKAEIESVSDTEGDLAASAERTGDALRGAVDSETVQRLAQVRSLMEANADQTAATAEQFDRLRESIKGAVQAQTEGGGGSGLSGLTAIGSKIRSLPSTQIPGLGIGTDAIGNLLRVAGALPPVALAAAGALGIVVGGIALLNKSLESSKQALDAALAAQDAYYKGLHDRTTQATKDQIKALEDTNKDIKAEMDNLAKSIEGGVKSTVDAFSGIVALGQNPYTKQALTNILVSLTPTKGVQDKFNDLQKQFNDNANSADALRRSLDSAEVATNDYNAALKKQIEVSQALAGVYASTELQIIQLRRTGSEQQLSDARQNVQDQLAVNNDLLTQFENKQKAFAKESDAYKQIQGIIDSYNEKNQQLSLSLTLLGDTTLEAAVKANDAAKEQQKAFEEIQRINAQITDVTTKHQEEIAAVQEKYAENLGKLKDAFEQANLDAALKEQQKELDLTTQLQQQLADDAEKNQQKQVELAAKFNDDRVKIETDYQNRVKEIERRYTADSTDAIQNRDAVALDRAQRQRDTDLSNAEAKRTEDLKAREADYQEQLRQLQLNQQRQQQERQRDYQRRLAEARLAYERESQQRAIKYERDKQQLAQAEDQEIRQRNTAYNRQLSELQSYLSEQEALNRGYYGNTLNFAQATIARINQLLGANTSGNIGSALTSPITIPGTAAASQNAYTPAPYYFPSFQQGGVVPRTGLIYAHAGEMIFNPKQPRGMGGVSFAPVIRGATRSQIRNELEKHINTLLDMIE